MLTVTEGGASATIQLDFENYTGITWSATQDSGTGTDIAVPCFCHGTLILTEHGDVPVEDLAIGNRVMTISGGAKPIRWIGWRSYAARFVAGNRAVLPIRVEAGAVAEGVPARDLWVSPEHALYIDGALVPARLLVNGTSIVQAEEVERVNYFHIELDAHDIIFAEGAPAETYVDCDNRRMFANGAEYDALYPKDDRPRWQFCAERLDEGSDRLNEIRVELTTRIEMLGFTRDCDPDPHLVVDGKAIRPDRVAGLWYRFAVPASSRAVWLASRSTVPAESDPAARDLRRLGLAVERIVLHDDDLRIEVGHGHAALCDGFHTGADGHRWTDGMARLPDALIGPFAGGFTLKVHLAARELAYPVPPPRVNEPRIRHG